MFDVRKMQLANYSKPYWCLTQNGVDVPYSAEDPTRKPAWTRKRDAREIADRLNSGVLSLEELQASRFGERKDPEASAQEKEIAETIVSQIVKSELWAIGAKNFKSLSRTTERLGGLQFQAAFFDKYHCIVRVELDGNDTYRVVLLSQQGTVLRQSPEDVYADNLTDVLVTYVEEHFRAKEQESVRTV